MTTKLAFTKITSAIHFDAFSGDTFERLCFAYLVRRYDWEVLDWSGQLGADGGRDICGVRSSDNGSPESFCFQCANHQQLKFLKLQKDIDKICGDATNIPTNLIVLCGCKISKKLREKTIEHAKLKGIFHAEVWSSVELEERIRKDTPSLLERFVSGEQFPDTSRDLRLFVYNTLRKTDDGILALLALAFDRSAFITPFYNESSLPAFRQALSDAIEVFNTGVRRTRDGHLISHIPCKHDLSDAVKATVNIIVNEIVKLRALFDNFLRNGEIIPCQCGNADCPTFQISPNAIKGMDSARVEILNNYRLLQPSFDVRLLHL